MYDVYIYIYYGIGHTIYVNNINDLRLPNVDPMSLGRTSDALYMGHDLSYKT